MPPSQTWWFCGLVAFIAVTTTAALGQEIERRSPQEEAYIRFGKRDGENREIFRRAADSSYIRFGKRSVFGPCTMHFLTTLPSRELRMDHLRSCIGGAAINRETRSKDDGYIRFGKRSNNDQSHLVGFGQH